MTNEHNGGPAFPLPVADQECHGRFESGYGGMTLRDYFSAQCDVSAYSPFETFKANKGYEPTVTELAEYIAKIRYDEADAMLKAREQSIKP